MYLCSLHALCHHLHCSTSPLLYCYRSGYSYISWLFFRWISCCVVLLISSSLRQRTITCLHRQTDCGVTCPLVLPSSTLVSLWLLSSPCSSAPLFQIQFLFCVVGLSPADWHASSGGMTRNSAVYSNLGLMHTGKIFWTCLFPCIRILTVTSVWFTSWHFSSCGFLVTD